MAGLRFGPNTLEVEAFLDRLRRLSPSQWERVKEASPNVGSVPDLDVRQAPEYFDALREATLIAKSDVFPGSESAFYDAMRTAQLVADTTKYFRAKRAEAASSAVVEGANLPPDAEADVISRVMSTAYEEESWRRVMNAAMIAAGALVLRGVMTPDVFGRLYRPFAAR